MLPCPLCARPLRVRPLPAPRAAAPQFCIAAPPAHLMFARPSYPQACRAPEYLITCAAPRAGTQSDPPALPPLPRNASACTVTAQPTVPAARAQELVQQQAPMKRSLLCMAPRVSGRYTPESSEQLGAGAARERGRGRTQREVQGEVRPAPGAAGKRGSDSAGAGGRWVQGHSGCAILSRGGIAFERWRRARANSAGRTVYEGGASVAAAAAVARCIRLHPRRAAAPAPQPGPGRRARLG